MPTLRFFPPSGSPQLFAVHKPITTLGRALGNDIHVPDASVLSHHAQVVFNGRDFEVEVLDKDAVLAINGKRKRRAFTKEFKAETVRLVRDSGKSVGVVARELDLTETALRDWVRQAEIDASRARQPGRAGLSSRPRRD